MTFNRTIEELKQFWANTIPYCKKTFNRTIEELKRRFYIVVSQFACNF